MALTTADDDRHPLRLRTILLAGVIIGLGVFMVLGLGQQLGFMVAGLLALGVALPLALFAFGAAWRGAHHGRQGDLPISRVLDLLNDGLVLTGSDGRVMHANRWYKRFCKRMTVSPRLTPEQVLEAVAARHPIAAQELRASGYRLARRLEAGEAHGEDVTIPLEDGKVSVLITVCPAQDGRALWTIAPSARNSNVRVGGDFADAVESFTCPAVFMGPETVRTNREFELRFGDRLDETTRGQLYQRLDSAAWTGGNDMSWPARPLAIPGLPPLRPARLLVEGGAMYIFGGVALDLPAGPGTDMRTTKALARLSELLEVAPVGVAFLDEHGRVRQCNQTFRDFTGSPAEAGTPMIDLFETEEGEDLLPFMEAALAGPSQSDPCYVRTTEPPKRVGQMVLNRMPVTGKPVTLAFVIDQTDQRNLELQFAQSQKMQAIGQLAGGVAHDFNNLLTAIIGYCDLLLARHSVGDPSFKDINQVKQNATRAANLTRQLLAFSRKQTMNPKRLQLTDCMADLSMLLKRLLGENISLQMIHGRDLWAIKADQGQLEQVVINLAVNARDAMKEGGALTIRTRNVSEGESRKMGRGLLPPAEYVLIEVADTGCGISEDNLEKIFEPFFTTKDVGEGTGLGLSMVYGIIKQTGGFIYPESEVDKGTTFRIYLPRDVSEPAAEGDDGSAGQAAQAKGTDGEGAAKPRDITGQGHILFVEDEDAVRNFSVTALKSRGYTVLEASGGEQALEILRDQSQPIDLVVSDVMMPQMDGPTMMREARQIRPDLRVVFISGYAENALDDELLDGSEFLPKPFTLKQLAEKVKDVLQPES